jgi:hypothetical protein
MEEYLQNCQTEVGVFFWCRWVVKFSSRRNNDIMRKRLEWYEGRCRSFGVGMYKVFSGIRLDSMVVSDEPTKKERNLSLRISTPASQRSNFMPMAKLGHDQPSMNEKILTIEKEMSAGVEKRVSYLGPGRCMCIA